MLVPGWNEVIESEVAVWNTTRWQTVKQIILRFWSFRRKILIVNLLHECQPMSRRYKSNLACCQNVFCYRISVHMNTVLIAEKINVLDLFSISMCSMYLSLKHKYTPIQIMNYGLSISHGWNRWYWHHCYTNKIWRCFFTYFWIFCGTIRIYHMAAWIFAL